MSSFNSSTPNFDNLFLQSLMGRLQIRPPPPSNNRQSHPLLSQSFEDFLLDAATNNFRFSDSDDDDDGDADFHAGGKSQLAKEEAKLEKELIKIVLSGNTETLKPNSGQAISIGEHHICVGFYEESGSDYRVWEWHGHVMLFDEENGYTPEYIYGNYFERLVGKASMSGAKKEKRVEEESVEKSENLGLRELIENGDSAGSRILHRSINASSPRSCTVLLSHLLSILKKLGNVPVEVTLSPDHFTLAFPANLCGIQYLPFVLYFLQEFLLLH